MQKEKAAAGATTATAAQGRDETACTALTRPWATSTACQDEESHHV